MQPRTPDGKRIAYIRIAFVTALVLLLILAGFQSIWVFGGSASTIMNQTGLQRARVQAIVKDVLILAYRPTDEHPQAVSELQNVLPIWEKTQVGLQQGDKSLQLPERPPAEVLAALALARSDYIAIDTAARVILAHADKPPDPIQVAIIVAHEHDYALAMSQVVNAWQQRIDNAFLRLYWIESGLVLVIIALVILIAILTSKQMKTFTSSFTHPSSSKEQL